MSGRLARAVVLAATAAAGYGFYVAARAGHWWIVAVCVLAAGGLSLAAVLGGGAVSRVHARRAVWLLEASIVGVVVIGGGIIVALAVLGGYIEGRIAEKDDPVSSAVAKTVGGAVGTIGALLFVTDFEKETGSFWPSSLTKKLFQSKFDVFARTSRGFEAVWEDRVSGNGPSGWGFRARLSRARIIAEEPIKAE